MKEEKEKDTKGWMFTFLSQLLSTSLGEKTEECEELKEKLSSHTPHCQGSLLSSGHSHWQQERVVCAEGGGGGTVPESSCGWASSSGSGTPHCTHEGRPKEGALQ